MKKTVVVILCWMTLIIQGITQDVEITTEINVPYKTTAKDPQNRHWYRGQWNNTNTPDQKDLLFTLFENDLAWTPGLEAPHEDMSADPKDYSLTISKVRLGDGGFYTCKTTDKSTRGEVYDLAAYLRVYKMPTLALTGLDEESYNEGDTVNVSCTLTDAYPDVDPQTFKIVWKNHIFDEPVNVTNNEYFSYEIQRSFHVTKEDNEQTVTCSVDVTVGPVVPDQSKILTVNYFSSGPVKVLINPQSPTEGESVQFTCDASDVEANPNVDVKWYRDDSEYEGWTNLEEKIDEVSAADNVTYSCSIENIVDFIKSEPEFLNVQSKNDPGGSGGSGGNSSSNLGAILGGVFGAVVVIVIAIVIVVLIKRQSKGPEKGGPRPYNEDDIEMSTRRPIGTGNNNQGVEYSEVGAAVPSSTPDIVPESDTPTYAEVKEPQKGNDEYTEVRNLLTGNQSSLTAPPGTEGLTYAEVIHKTEPGKNSSWKSPRKPASATKKQVQEPTEYADIDQVKSANYNKSPHHRSSQHQL